MAVSTAAVGGGGRIVFLDKGGKVVRVPFHIELCASRDGALRHSAVRIVLEGDVASGPDRMGLVAVGVAVDPDVGLLGHVADPVVDVALGVRSGTLAAGAAFGGQEAVQ